VLVETDAGEFSAQVVVGADGSKGVTRRVVQPGAGGHTARVLELLTPVIASLVPSEARELGTEPRNLSSGKEALRRSGEPRAAEHHADHAYLDFFPVPAGIAGYVWDFPTQVNREPMRCWGIYDANLRPHAARPHLKAPLVDEMSRHGLDLNDNDLQGHPIHWFSPRNRVSAPRVLLVGDAAGVDGIFGEGISIALGHGQLAAQAIRDAFQRSDYSFRGYRPGLLLSPLGQALTARWMIMQILYHLRWRWFHWLLWRVLKPLVPAGGMRFVLSWARRMK
jgi:flavin-dependent dehydrogenase